MRPRHAGFGLIEALVSISILAILAALAQPSFAGLIASQRIRATAAALQAACNLARAEALKHNANAVIAPLSSGAWTSGWTVTGQTVGTGVTNVTLDSASRVNGIVISGPGQLTFNSAGRLASGSTAGSFKFSSSATNEIRCLWVDVSGIPTLAASGC